MTQEQKAKAYDEALNWMRELYPGLHGATKEDVEHFFPELAESEDENLKNKSGYYKAGKFWKASTLWNAIKNKVPQRVPNRYILQECTWNIGTLQRFADEVKNVQEVSLDNPIILDMNGNIIDGAHRVVKAYLEGKDIDIVYIGDDEWPEPDYDEEKAVKESEDERIRKWLLDYAIEMIAALESDISLSTYDGIKGHDPEAEAELAQWQKARAYLEKIREKSLIPDELVEGYKKCVLSELMEGAEIINAINDCQNQEFNTDSAMFEEEFKTGLEVRLKEQKENPKSADSIPSDCTAGAKCEDRWHKVEDSLPDNPREVLCKDEARNYFIGRYYAGEGWEISNYDDEDKPHHLNPPVSKWIDFPSEKQKEQKPVPFSCGHENGQQAEWAVLRSEFNINEAFENGKKEVIDHPDKYGLTKQQSVERSLEDDHIIGFVYDLLNEIEWKDNWAMSKEECLRLLSNYSPQKITRVTINGEPISAENKSVDIPLAEWSEEDAQKLVPFSCGHEKGQPGEKQDYSELNDLERAILRGFLAAGVENVPIGIIKDTASECVGSLALTESEPVEWSEEDGKTINDACCWIAEYAGYLMDKNYGKASMLMGLTDKLKSLRPQPKQEWSEEDKKMIESIVETIQDYALETGQIDAETGGTKEPLISYINFLWSLRPSWKPNKEQMEALERASTNKYLSAKQFDILVSLYKQLKKLM